MNPLILHGELSPTTPAIVVGKGLPSEINGQPCAYRRKEIARVGDYVHPGDGNKFSISADRMDKWVNAFNKRAAKGRKPFITPFHVDHRKDPDARDTLGYVVGMQREGEGLFALEQLIGEDAVKAADKNDVSIYVAEAQDSDNEKWSEALLHLALTPNPALTNLGGHVAIAASAGGGVAQVPLYELSATAKETPMLSKDTLAKLRAKLKLGDAKDEDVAEKAAALALSDPPADKSAEVTALSAKVAELIAERDTLKLSAAPKQYDELALSLIGESFATKREQAICAGGLSKAAADKIESLVCPNGKPGVLALSAGAGDTRPFLSRLYEFLAECPGVKTNNGTIRASAAPSHNSETNEADKPITRDRIAELAGYAGVTVK